MGVVKLSTAGILNYQKYDDFLAGNAAFIPAAYEWLETISVGTPVASVEFTNVNTNYASAYKHLQIRYTARASNNVVSNNLIMTFNSDSGTNYSRHALFGSGGSVGSFGLADQNWFTIGNGAGNSSTANAFGAGVIDILDPFETTKFKTSRALSGNPTDVVTLFSGLWRNTAAITTITIDQQTGGDWSIGSRFSLYGLRSA